MINNKTNIYNHNVAPNGAQSIGFCFFYHNIAPKGLKTTYHIGKHQRCDIMVEKNCCDPIEKRRRCDIMVLLFIADTHFIKK